jgi:hypothetical protein
MTRKILIGVWINCLIGLTVVLIFGCASTGPRGTLTGDTEVKTVFESYQVLEGYNYYFNGPQGRPTAILAVRSEYELVNPEWIEFQASSVQLKKWVDWYDQTFGMRTQYYPNGFRIRSPTGEEIGMWYSIEDRTVVIVEEADQVIIYPPNMMDPIWEPTGSRHRRMR